MTDNLWMWFIAAIPVLLAIGLWALVWEAKQDAADDPMEFEPPSHSPWEDR